MNIEIIQLYQMKTFILTNKLFIHIFNNNLINIQDFFVNNLHKG